MASRGARAPALPVPSLAPHRVMTGGVDDVDCSHVLIQEVTADGNRVATTAVVFLNGDTRSESGSGRAKTAPGVGGGKPRAGQHQRGGVLLPPCLCLPTDPC